MTKSCGFLETYTQGYSKLIIEIIFVVISYSSYILIKLHSPSLTSDNAIKFYLNLFYLIFEITIMCPGKENLLQLNNVFCT